jgi:hypothetical protein
MTKDNINWGIVKARYKLHNRFGDLLIAAAVEWRFSGLPSFEVTVIATVLFTPPIGAEYPI